MAIQKAKGTIDYFGIDTVKRRYIEGVARSVMRSCNFEEIITPTFESTELFSRSSGETSDIVTKEMFTFLDKSNKSLTLRPEGTASIVRALLENKLYATPGLKKYFYNMPMYRCERPQAGRFREFNQFGIEVFGENSYLLDADIIALGDMIFSKLGLKGKYKIVVNTIGDLKSRSNYQDALKTYFKNHLDLLCDDCKKRIEKNPMRILDCKVDKDSDILKNAPSIVDYLNNESKEYFNNFLKTLDYLGIDYEVDYSLVRGLDYYTDTVFEFISVGDDKDTVKSLKGSAICAGGRYSGLTKELNGPDVPGIGFAFGVERVLSLLDFYNYFPEFNKTCDLCILSLDEESKLYSLKLMNEFKRNGFVCEMDYVNTSLKPQFKLSERVDAKYIIIIGETERKTGKVCLKDVSRNESIEMNINEIENYLKTKLYN